VEYEHFEEFAVKRPLKGLGTTMDWIWTVAGTDAKLLNLLDRAVQRPHGGKRIKGQGKSDNITLDPNPRGTSEEGALRRLRKDKPELHTEVLAGRLSAHAAMVEAGFRKRTLSVPISDPEATGRALRRHLEPGALARLAELLGRA
jgi:hypothetical protein